MKILAAMCFAAIAAFSLPGQAFAAPRCAKPSEDEARLISRFKILRICDPLTVRLDSSIVELPADLIVAAMAPTGVVFRNPGNRGHIVFDASKRSDHKSYVVCSAKRRAYSDIPGLGKYVKHGLQELTPTAVKYGWQLKRRRYHNVRFVYDVTVSFVPQKLLTAARRAGACSTEQEIRSTLRWLT